MTTPGNPPQLPPTGPRTYSVPIKPCCGLLDSDFCDCVEWANEVYAAFANGPSVMWRGGRVEVTR